MSTMTMADEIMLAAPGEPIVNITAYTARQKASGYVGSYISHLMGGGEPSFFCPELSISPETQSFQGNSVRYILSAFAFSPSAKSVNDYDKSGIVRPISGRNGPVNCCAPPMRKPPPPPTRFSASRFIVLNVTLSTRSGQSAAWTSISR